MTYNLRSAEHAATSSNFKKRRIQWSNIWNNDAPPKIKVFAWRLAKEALHTNVNKKNRHMNMIDMCDICGEGSEDAFHAVVDCQHSKNLIQAARKEWSVPDDELLHRNGPEWFLQLLDKLPKQDRGFFIMLLWKNWNDRNAITHGDQRHSVEGSLRALSALCKTLYQIRQPTQPQLKSKNVSHEYLQRRMDPSNVKSARAWVPPEEGWLKVNVDGSFVEATGEASAGVVIRNAAGEVWLATLASMLCSRRCKIDGM